MFDTAAANATLPGMELMSGEQIVLEGHPSWRSTMAFYVKGILVAAVLGVIVGLIGSNATGVAVALGVFAIFLVVGFVRRWTTKYIVTNRRLHIKRGIIARHTQEAKLARVQNINTRQSVIERLLQVGTVDFDTAGSGESEANFAFIGVNDPLDMAHKIEAAQQHDPTTQRYESEQQGQGL
jgi:uncharacterized membrane protein YdbT with pleckstrin-like domain